MRVMAFDARSWQALAAAERLRKLVRDYDLDVVLSFLVHANSVAAMARRRGDGVRWVQSVQTTQPRPRWHWHAQRLAARRADGFIVPSRSIQEAAHARSGIDPRRVTVIPNGVDAAEVVDSARERQAGTTLRVGFLGRLDPVKRVPMLVAAVRGLAGVELHVFGDGFDRPRVERAARGLANVTLHGFADRRAALSQIDVLCLPSIAEGFPMSVVEAMAAGVPVVGADVPGVRDAIARGETGLLFTGTVAGTAAALAAVRDDPVAATRRASAALDVVRTDLTWQRIVPRYADVLFHSPAR